MPEENRKTRRKLRAKGLTPRELHLNPRALKKNPRAKGTNPRSVGTNPRKAATKEWREWYEATKFIKHIK